jgi:hypothetical protein
VKKNPLVETVTRNRCVPTGIAADAQFGCSSCLVALDRVKLARTPVFRQPFGVVVIKTVVSALHPRPVQPNPNPIKSRPTSAIRQRVAAASSIDYGHKI